MAAPPPSYDSSLKLARTKSAPRPKMGEIKLFDNTKERRGLESLADLYSIIRATEALETAYSRDSFSSGEYAEACTKLISQFKTTGLCSCWVLLFVG